MQDTVASDLIPFFLAGFALVGTPGPATFTLAATSAAYGPRRGVELMAGLLTSIAAIGAITAAGITTLLPSLPGARPIGSVLAGAYLLYLAWRRAGPHGGNGTWKGTSSVKGDQMCRDYGNSERPSCRKFSKVSPNTYLSFDEDGNKTSTFVILPR